MPRESKLSTKEEPSEELKVNANLWQDSELPQVVLAPPSKTPPKPKEEKPQPIDESIPLREEDILQAVKVDLSANRVTKHRGQGPMAELMALCKSNDQTVRRQISELVLNANLNADRIRQYISTINRIWREQGGVPVDRTAFVLRYLRSLCT